MNLHRAVLSEVLLNSLANKKVLVTRAVNQNAELIRMLESKGAIALPFPCIEIHHETVPTIDWNLFDSIVFTSSNGQKSFSKVQIPTHIQICTYANRLSPTGRVLLVQGNLADNSLAETLCSKGHSVTRLNTYRTEIGSGGINLADHKLDTITFTSPSTAENFLKRGGRQTDELIACIGSTTYEACIQLGYSNLIYPKEHSLEGLLRILLSKKNSNS
jgi:uroporphyrinogen-III synthase